VIGQAIDLRLPGGVRGIAGLIGAIFTLVGSSFVLIGGGIGLITESLSSLMFVGIGALFTVLGVLALTLALGARLWVAADGTLSVRSLPPWPRRVALGELTRVEARTSGYVWVSRRPVRPRVIVRLDDRAGRSVSIDFGAWGQCAQRPALAAILARAAGISGAVVDEATQTYLARGVPPL
jgi:hypothetical protein